MTIPIRKHRKPTHGGARPGAGRPPSGDGPREKVAGSLGGLALAILDSSRGDRSRWDVLESLIFAAYERGDLLPAVKQPGPPPAAPKRRPNTKKKTRK